MPPVLNSIRGFESLDEAARVALEDACAGITSVGPDTDLVRQGEASDRLHVLVDGWACRTKLLDDGRRQIPALLLPGDPCDLDRLATPRLAYGVATLTPCKVAVWSCHALLAVMRDHPGVGAALLRLALVDNALMTQAAVVLARLSAREKLAHLLCELLARLEAIGRAEPDGCVLPLTQAKFADVLGLSAVHVNRVLQELRGEGLIRLAGDRLTVLDRDALYVAGKFRPDHLLMGGTGSDLPTEYLEADRRWRSATGGDGASLA